MDYKLPAVVAGLMLFCLMSSPVFAAPAGDAGLPGTSAAMQKADFWIEKLPAAQQLIMTPEGIGAFNRAIYAAMPYTVMDLSSFPESIDKNTLQRWLSADKLPRGKERYADGRLLTGADYDALEQNLNLAGLQEKNTVLWGFAIRRTDLRTFPTGKAASEDDESDDFDLFQETAVNIAEPLAVLYRSKDYQWLYVQTYNYRGWLRLADVAMAPSRKEWQAKREQPFVMITGTKVAPRDTVMGKPVPDWRAGMGTRLPFLGRESEGYGIEIPQRGPSGAVVWKKAWIHGKADVTVGVLPYTRANILRQAFKMLGENYGWGGLNEGRDCSSFIMDIYNVFGIRAPRNADQQERVPGRRAALKDIADNHTRYALIEQAEPGATLHMRNHVMMYLGEHGGKHYAIHSLGSYGDASNPRADGSLPRVEVMRIIVGGLDLPLRSGRRFVEVLSSVNSWQ